MKKIQILCFASVFALLLSAGSADALYFHYEGPQSSGGGYGYSSGSSGSYSSYGTSALAQTLSASCAPMQTSARVGEVTTWYTSTTGGNGKYQYYWSGTDAIAGHDSTLARAYATAGEKFATVTVTSGSQSITTGCTHSVTVFSVISPPIIAAAPVTPAKPKAIGPTAKLQALCSADKGEVGTNDPILWSVAAIGGAGSYAFDWHGSEELSGKSATVTKKYLETGDKDAFVIVSSGTEKTVVACSEIAINERRTDGGLIAGVFGAGVGIGSPLLLALLALAAVGIAVYLANKKHQKEKKEAAHH